MYCPKCGSQNSDQMKYCQKCGSVLNSFASSGGAMPQTGSWASSGPHALIALNEGKFYVMDTNSTNHVFIDGKPIPPQTPVMLADGMKVRFADEMYQFSMS